MTVPPSSRTIFTHAYELPGGLTGNEAGALLVLSDSTSAASWKNASGAWDDDDFTLEIWFKPDNLDPDPSNGQILFEDGGGSGLGLFIANGQLVCSQDSNVSVITYDLANDPDSLLLSSPATSDFIQAVITRASTGETALYVNGSQVGTATNAAGAFSGGDSAAFGTRGGNNTGGRGGGQSNTESFDGQLAQIRVYHEQLLSEPDVQKNFDEIEIPDEINPSIVSLSPADDSSDQYVAADLVATFDEEVALVDGGTVTIRNLSEGSDLTITLPDSRVSVSGPVLTISPSSNLSFGTDYAVRISADAIEDVAAIPNAFGGITDDTTWNFNTSESDATAPVVSSFNPVNGAVDVSGNPSLTATFDENILLNSAGPAVLFEEDFDDDDGGFTLVGSPNDWEWGTPDSDNSFGLVIDTDNSGTGRCWATVLGAGGTAPSGSATVGVDSILRSPETTGDAIDLTGVGGVSLEFAAALDVNTGDTVEILVKEVGTDNILTTILPLGESPAPAITTEDWTDYGPFDLSDAVGSEVYLEFRYVGTDEGFPGLYIDDIVVTGIDISSAITLRNLTDGIDTLIPTGDSNQVSVDGNVLTITPSFNLGSGKDYAVKIGDGAIRNFSEVPFAGIADDTSWAFTTTNLSTFITDANVSGNDTWSQGDNWDTGSQPSGISSAVISAGLTARADSKDAEPYSGGLTLETGATLRSGAREARRTASNRSTRSGPDRSP